MEHVVTIQDRKNKEMHFINNYESGSEVYLPESAKAMKKRSECTVELQDISEKIWKKKLRKSSHSMEPSKILSDTAFDVEETQWKEKRQKRCKLKKAVPEAPICPIPKKCSIPSVSLQRSS
ncbi:hypothetical protein NPIL_324861 [Nephila pilipes]|uniref:Uncharacterized protein n=1 Tax=Nephila pilipes TaxID=299642 RepID=A0A8X6UFE1_NEPPI|nr:hypothetical protein NPIL_492201 [Nephila pilipes]GFU24330.1 hypothetical protein NPIL_324861 [Nephila pilipes]